MPNKRADQRSIRKRKKIIGTTKGKRRLEVHFSAKKQDHGTPLELYKYLDKKYHFKADLYASKRNALHWKYFTEENRAECNRWPTPGYSFANPPYGREIYYALEYAVEQSIYRKAGSVFLLPARTDTKWFHKFVLPFAHELVFIDHRLIFRGNSDPAPFPSILVVYGRRKGPLKISTLSREDYMPRGKAAVKGAKKAVKSAVKAKAKKAGAKAAAKKMKGDY